MGKSLDYFNVFVKPFATDFRAFLVSEYENVLVIFNKISCYRLVIIRFYFVDIIIDRLLLTILVMSA